MEAPREVLTEADKKFIIENYSKMSVLQMAMRLNIKTEGRKCPIISDFIKSAGLAPAPTQESIAVDVKPPETSFEKTVEAIIEQPTIDDSGPDVPYENITVDEFANILRGYSLPIHNPISEKERRDIIFLLKQMESTRYLLTYKTYKKKEYKNLFKEEFIRHMFGKGDMPQEEVNDFIDMCSQLVYQHDLKCKILELEKLKEKQDISTQHRIGADAVIVQMNDKLDLSVKRVGEIKKQLGATREQRLKDSRPVGLTVIALIEAVQNEEKRASLLKMQENKDEKLIEVFAKLDELESNKALIMGISLEELKKGAA